MDKIYIRDLIAQGIIGVYDEERQGPQDILINIVLFTDLHKAGISDDVNDSVDYQVVAEEVLAHTENACRFTVESLATDIAKICLQFPGVEKVRIRVEKPGVIGFARSVGVEIERSKV